MAIVQAINGVAETYPVKPVTPRAALVDGVDSQAGKDPRHLACRRHPCRSVDLDDAPIIPPSSDFLQPVSGKSPGS